MRRSSNRAQQLAEAIATRMAPARPAGGRRRRMTQSGQCSATLQISCAAIAALKYLDRAPGNLKVGTRRTHPTGVTYRDMEGPLAELGMRVASRRKTAPPGNDP